MMFEIFLRPLPKKWKRFRAMKMPLKNPEQSRPREIFCQTKMASQASLLVINSPQYSNKKIIIRVQTLMPIEGKGSS